jgi:DNA or RNA helicases of superfamily II
VLIHAGPGAGKTLGALLAFQAMQREGRFSRVLVFCHRTSILEQWQRAAERLGLHLQLWNGPGSAPLQADGWLVSYQGAGPTI